MPTIVSMDQVSSYNGRRPLQEDAQQLLMLDTKQGCPPLSDHEQTLCQNFAKKILLLNHFKTYHRLNIEEIKQDHP